MIMKTILILKHFKKKFTQLSTSKTKMKQLNGGKLTLMLGNGKLYT